MLRVIGVAAAVLFSSLLIKDKKPVFAVCLSVSGVCIILYSVFSEIRLIVSEIGELTASVPSTREYIKLMLKVLSVTVLTQAVSDICRDNGETALAGVTETASKIVIIALVLPLFQTVITIVNGLIK